MPSPSPYKSDTAQSIRLELTSPWAVYYTRSNHEFSVFSELKRRDIECFLPLYPVTSRWSDRTKTTERPLYPNYVFARYSSRDDALGVRAPGLVAPVQVGDDVALVSHHEIAAIFRILNSGLHAAPCDSWIAGEPVRIVSGPLAGLSATVIRQDEEDRVFVGVDMFNRGVTVRLDRRWLAATSGNRAGVPRDVSEALRDLRRPG